MLHIMTKPIKHEPTVNMGNDLIRAAHNLKLIEKRLLMLAISKIDSKAASTGRNQTISLTVKEYLSEYSTDRTSTYRELAKALDGLDSTRVKFKDESIGERGTIHWTTGTRYREMEGSFIISINGDLLPFLHDLKSHFTTYKLHRVSGLKSGYSWRLFELLMQFKSTGLLSISIDDFNHALETPNSLRANFANLRNRVIEPALKEITEKDGLKVAYEQIKAGRKVTGLKFTFKPEKTEKPATKYPTLPDAELELIDKPMTKAEAAQVAFQIIGKAKKVSTEIMPLDELKSRLDAAYNFAKVTGDAVDKYLTDADRKALKHYKIKV